MSLVEQEKAKKSSNNLIVRVNRPVRDLHFSGFKEIYQFTVEQTDPPPETVIVQEPEEPPKISMTDDELNEKISDAFKQGLSEGRAQQEAELRQEIKQEFELLHSIAHEVVKLKSEFLQKSEEMVLRLAFQIASKIVKTELSTQPDALLANLKSAISKLSSIEKNIVIRLNPVDVEIVQAHRDNLHLPITEFKLTPDEHVTRGGCRVETNYSTIDATLETQLQSIEQALQKEFENG